MSASLKSRHSSSSAAAREAVENKPEPESAQVNIVETDNTYLEHLGYKPEFKRAFSFLGLFSLAQSGVAILPAIAGTIW